LQLSIYGTGEPVPLSKTSFQQPLKPLLLLQKQRRAPGSSGPAWGAIQL